MKKICCFIVCLILSQVLFLNSAYAETNEPETENPDSVMADTLKDFTDSEDYEFNKRDLYDITLNKIGYVYEFTADNENGFGIVVKEGDKYAVNEFYLDADNPYDEDEISVYAGYNKFLNYAEGDFYDCFTGEKVLSNKFYCGSVNLTKSESYNIYFDRKTDSEYSLTNGIPCYTSSTNINVCANVSGANVIGYYDYYYPEMIPDFAAYQNGKYIDQDYNQPIWDLIDNLYYLMKTDVYQGTSVDWFKTGLTSYVNSKGRSVTYTVVSSNGTLNESAAYQDFYNQIPIVIFLNNYNIITSIYSTSSYDYIKNLYFGAMHTMVAFGYRNIYYYQNQSVRSWSPVWYNPFRYITTVQEVNTRTDKYLHVSTGNAVCDQGYIRLYDECNLDYAMAIEIS